MEETDKIRDATKESMRSSLKGLIGEQLAPLFLKFNYDSSDARFIGKPIDFIVFDEMKDNDPKKNCFY